MRAWGVTYDTGFESGGTTTHEPFEVEVVRRDLAVIARELRCDAVRVTGGRADRLEVAARLAAEQGLEVWWCPFTNGLDTEELLAFLLDAAERAERLRQAGAEVVMVTGSEISLFTTGFLPGEGVDERAGVLTDPQRIRSVQPAVQAGVRAFLERAVAGVRGRFGGKVTYAALPHEGVDWAPFDLIASDAVYRDAATAPRFRELIRAATSQGRPFAVTEFGCATYRGAADLGGRADAIVEWDDHARPRRLTSPVRRDEEEQARCVLEVLRILDEEGVDTAFVNTFARRDLPTSPDPERDFDVASWGIVKVLPEGGASATHPGQDWEPKAAFHALAAFGATRR